VHKHITFLSAPLNSYACNASDVNYLSILSSNKHGGHCSLESF